MLCRALLAAVVLSYVLCVLLLSGVQKEDIDAGTLRKLQRHNVNIDDINDQQIRKQCLGKTVTTLRQENPVTQKIITEILTEKEIPFEKDKVGAEDRSNLRRIFEFLEDNRKGEKKKALTSKDNSSTLRPAPNNKLRSSSSHRSRNINVEDTNSETSEIRGTSGTDKDDEKTKKATMNKKLENLINIWRSDIDTVSYTTRQESTTEKVNKDDPISKNTKDFEYIKKIIEEIMSKKKINEPQIDFNATFKEADQMSDAQTKNKTIAPTNYYLNHCKLGNFYTHNQDDKDKYAIFDNDKQLISGTNELVKNANDEGYVICKSVEAKEKKMLTDRLHDNMLYNLLNTLKQESQRINPDNESATRTSFDNHPKNANRNQQKNHVKTSNIYKKVPLDNEIIAAFKNQSESIISNKQSDNLKTRDDYKNGLSLLDPETAIALETALERQTNIYNQIFSRQRDQVQVSNTDKEKIKLFENERRKVLQSALIANPPTFNNKPTKQDDDINKEYNNWRFVLEPQENVIINNVPYIKKEKSTNTLSTMGYDINLGKQYKRPWFYSEVSNGQLKTKNKETLKGIFFIPNNKMTRTEPRQKNAISKKWSPYFDSLGKNASIIETDENQKPKSQQPILVDSYGLVQLNNRELSQELTENSEKHSNAVGFYHNKNDPNIIKNQRDDQFETKTDKKMSQSHCLTIHETKTCFPDAEYKSDWAYFRNKQIEKQMLNMKEQNEGSEYSNYQFPSRTRNTKNRYDIAEEELANRNEAKDSIKLPAFPQNVIKDIANSIKDIVLKDLITTTIIPPKTTTPLMTTSLPITTTTTTTTTATTFTTSTMTTTTIKTTDGTSKAETEQPSKIDASKALEKIIEMFEKINTIKEKNVKHANVTYREDVRYDTEMEATTQTILNPQVQPIQRKTEYRLAYEPQSLQPNLEKQTPYDPQPFQPNPENRVQYKQQPLQYIPQALQIKPDNSTYVPPAMQLRGSNRLPYVPQPSQSNPENRTPYFPPAVQLPAENRSPYDPQNLQSNSGKRGPYFPPALQLKAESRIPYIPQAVQMETENSTPYRPQAVQMKTENNIPRDTYNQQNLQSKLENHTPYFPAASQMRAENRVSYDSQPLQSNTENRVPYDQPLFQKNLGNREPYDQPSLQKNLGNRVPYDQPPLQKNLVNRVPYDQPPLQNNLGNRVPYDQPPLQNNLGNRIQYDSQALPSNPGNRIPYDQPPLQSDLGNRVPYDPQPQRGPKNLYSIKNPYYNSKLVLDPYQDKEVLEPIKQKSKPRKYAITVQTNSGEIAPLKIAVQKPILQTIILTTKSPAKVKRRPSGETLNSRKPKSVSTRHQVDKPKESEISNNGEIKQYFSRPIHRDAYGDRPKSRKTKNEREVTQQYKSRGVQDIERFHEKLERGDAWAQYEEEKIAKRVQRPIVKNTNYDDTHFRNFLQTQQKVNAMLERILATSKNKLISTEVV